MDKQIKIFIGTSGITEKQLKDVAAKLLGRILILCSESLRGWYDFVLEG